MNVSSAYLLDQSQQWQQWLRLQVKIYASMIAGHSMMSRPKGRLWAVAIGAVFMLMLFLSMGGRPSTTFKTNDAQIIELEGLTMGSPFDLDDSGEAKRRPIESFIESVKARYIDSAAHVGAGKPEFATCKLSPERYQRTVLSSSALTRWSRKSTIAIAINLHESADIIPAQSLAILEAVAHLLPYHEVYISVYENGPTEDDKRILSDFVAAAQRIGADGVFAVASRMLTPGQATQDRIIMLSEIRNHVLKPLVPYISSHKKSTVLFVNDVVTCASDILELLHQQRLQKADAVLAMDWGVVDRELGMENAHARLYDSWVARGINGDLFYEFEKSAGFWPVTKDNDWVRGTLATQSPEVYQRWLDGRPVPVYSGWGGMAAFDGRLFSQDHVRFRSSIKSGWSLGSVAGGLGAWGRMIATDGYLDSDCPGASECEYICRDIWNLRGGRARIMVAPQSRTAYSIEDWEALIRQIPATRRQQQDDTGDLIDWQAVKIPESVDCIASRKDNGDYVYTWEDDNERYRLNPLWTSQANSALQKE